VIYLFLCVGPLSLGILLLFAPRRGGNFLNGAFVIFPEVKQRDPLRKTCYRVFGLACIAVSGYYIHSICLNLGLPLAHFFRSSR
jgi:hypothetical protein